MKTKYENKSLLLNVDLANKKKGDKISIQVQKVINKKPIPKKDEEDEQKYKEEIEYIPVDRYWRDRLKDAKIDKCVEIIDKDTKETLVEKSKPAKKQTAKK